MDYTTTAGKLIQFRSVEGVRSGDYVTLGWGTLNVTMYRIVAVRFLTEPGVYPAAYALTLDAPNAVMGNLPSTRGQRVEVFYSTNEYPFARDLHPVCTAEVGTSGIGGVDGLPGDDFHVERCGDPATLRVGYTVNLLPVAPGGEESESVVEFLCDEHLSQFRDSCSIDAIDIEDVWEGVI